MRVLSLTRYDRLGASSRLRSMQYHPYLRHDGFAVEHAPLFSNDYVLGLQRGRRQIADVVMSYGRRVKQLICSKQYDLLWIEKELLPWVPAWVEHWFVPAGIPYVLDYDDAVFHYYDEHRSARVRTLLGGKHPRLMRDAAAVVAGNDYLADFARRSGAMLVEVIPTVVDLERYPVQATTAGAFDENEPPVIVWIGQRSTAPYLNSLAPLFKRLRDTGRARVVAIGVDTAALGLPMDSVPWSEASEVEMLSQGAIGIMPLPDDAFARGKCGYKLVQYMACSLPVVASPVGVNTTLVSHDVNGFLAEGPSDWEVYLSRLLDDRELRLRMGRAGRAKVEHAYSLQVTAPRLATLFRRVCTGARNAR